MSDHPFPKKMAPASPLVGLAEAKLGTFLTTRPIDTLGKDLGVKVVDVAGQLEPVYPGLPEGASQAKLGAASSFAARSSSHLAEVPTARSVINMYLSSESKTV
jgi:hypothetical protein